MINKTKSFLLLIFIIATVFTGCTKSESTIHEGDIKDYVYVAEQEAFADKNYIQGICSYEDKLYMTTYHQQTGSNRTYVIDCLSKQIKPFFLPLEENGISEIQKTAIFEGNLFFIEKVTEGEESEKEIASYFIKSCDIKQGELLDKVDITTILNDHIITDFTIDMDGNFCLTIDRKILVLNSQGKLMFETSPNIKWFLDINTTSEGTPVFLAADVEEGLCVGIIDVEKGGLGKVYRGIQGGNTTGGIVTGFHSEMYLNCNDKVYNYDVNDGSLSEEFRWNESNLLSKEVKYLMQISDGNFVAVLSESNNNEEYNTKIAYLNKTPRSEADMRTVLVLGTLTNGEWIQAVANYYNGISNDYRVEVKSYFENEIQLQLDLVSGQGPDILDTTGLDVSQLEAKGLIEDLTPYLAKDEDLKDVEFFDSVCKANTVNGKLICLPPYFQIETLYARVSEFGNIGGLTIEAMYECIKEKEDDRRIFSVDQNLLLRILLAQNASQFIDWNSGECNFNSKEFIAFLECAKNYGMTDEEEQRLIEEIDDGGRYESAMLEYDYMLNALSYKSMCVEFGEAATCIGFPVSDESGGNGSTIENLYGFLMCSSSENKEGVWNFLKMLLMGDYYDILMEEEPGNMAFPIRKDIFEQAFDEWMEIGEVSDFNGQEHEISLTQEDKDYIVNLIECTDRLSNHNYEIYKIIEEETQAFYQNQKSANEVAEIIQSRVQLYVNEQR